MLPEYLEDGYAEMLAAGHAPGHVRKVHAILSSAYEDEVKRGNVARNPCRLVEPPALAPAGKTALTAGQARAVLAAIEGRRNSSRWKVGLACGLRQGEALGLRWRDVDLEDLVAKMLDAASEPDRLALLGERATSDAARLSVARYREASYRRLTHVLRTL